MNITEKIEKTLKDANVDFKFIPLPENLAPDVPSHAAFHHIKLDQAMTTILYKTEKGIIAVVKRADTKVNEEKVKKVAGIKELVFAKKADLEKLEVETGMVPYLAMDVPFYVDEKILTVGMAYGTGGANLLGMAMEAKDMVKVNHGTVGDFAEFEKSVDLSSKKHRILSGITPSGDGSLHIGNYLGAVRQFIDLAKNHEMYLMVADLHGLTTIQDKKQFAHNVETLVLNELALLKGFLTEEEFSRIVFFRQSDVPMHTELQSILNNITPLGLLKRAHAYKDKLAKDVMEDDVNLGLFNYPILMAADILLYKPDLVPVGKDQKQHIEITRDIAERFNRTFNKVFPLPEPYIPEEVAVVLGTDGQRKMSKSLGNLIAIFEDEAVIKKQVNGTYTDPTRKHATDPGHIEGNMVFAYLDYFGEKEEVASLKERYIAGKVGDVEVKEYLFASLMTMFAPARKTYEELKSDPKKVKAILANGAAKANAFAAKTMDEVRKAIGVTNGYSFFQYGKNASLDPSAAPQDDSVTIDQFSTMDLRVGLVKEARNAEGSEKLIRLTVSFGELGERVIFTGVRPFGYTPEFFAGKQFLFIANLAPRKMMNEMSQGMILAVDDPVAKKPIFVSGEGMPVGSRVR